MARFDGVRCLVTGAADGIGRATARRLLDEGARVLACDIDEAVGHELPAAATLVVDVAAGDAPARLMAAAEEHRVLALELGPLGITVNYVQPGAIVTGITRPVFDADPAFRTFWTGKSALGRLGQPEDVAAAIAFLASTDAAFVTGHGLVVDGGAMQSP